MGRRKYIREKHGLSKSRTYKSWIAAKNRAFNKNGTDYDRYGGRGITMCPRWQESFLSFLDDMGHSPDGCTLERINNNGNYEPGNCRWANRKEQSNNTSRNRQLEYDGKTKTLSQWAEEYNMKYMVLYDRLALGWGMEEALTRRNRSNELTILELVDIKKRIANREPIKSIALYYHVHHYKISRIKRQYLESEPCQKSNK